MKFSEEDKCWHWEAEWGYTGGSGLHVYFIILFLSIEFAAAAIFDGHLKHIRADLLVGGCLAVVFAIFLFSVMKVKPREKARHYYAADENGFYLESKQHIKGRICRYEHIVSIRQFRNENKIVFKTPGRNRTGKMRVYVDDNDFDEVWTFLKSRCCGAEVIESILENGKEKRIRREMSSGKKNELMRLNCWILGGTLVFFSLIFSMGMLGQSDMNNYTGLGEAEILRIERIISSVEDGVDYYTRCDIDGNSFLYTDHRRNSTGWKVGTVVPVTYNVMNTSRFIIGKTPEEYRNWYRVWNMIIWSMRGIAVLFIIGGIWAHGRIRKQRLA